MSGTTPLSISVLCGPSRGTEVHVTDTQIFPALQLGLTPSLPTGPGF